MAALTFALPFLFLALVPLGGWLGGAWTFSAAVAAPLCLAGLDLVFGEDAAALAGGTRGARLLIWLYIPLQLAATAWAAWIASRPSTSLIEAAGLVVSTGLTAGVFGFVAAHEMIHSRRPAERALGLCLLASVFYMHFAIAHVHGHHRRAATRDDPATARLGESLYAFAPRSIAGQAAEAWRFEAQRLRRGGRRVIGPGNRVLVYLGLEALLAFGLGLAGWRVLGFVAASAAVSILLLEAFNYVAHYGLQRRRRPDGRPERLGPQHSWNTARRMNNWSLFNMGRHSDHHRVTTRPYPGLEMLAGAAQLPSGYAGAMLLAIVPPLWRRVMDPRALAAARAGQP